MNPVLVLTPMPVISFYDLGTVLGRLRAGEPVIAKPLTRAVCPGGVQRQCQRPVVLAQSVWCRTDPQLHRSRRPGYRANGILTANKPSLRNGIVTPPFGRIVASYLASRDIDEKASSKKTSGPRECQPVHVAASFTASADAGSLAWSIAW